MTTATNELTIGNIAILVVSTDNIQTTDGNSSNHTSVTDSAGNNWQKLGEYTNGNGAAAAGVTCSVWFTKATATLAVGGTITINLSGAVVDKCCLCNEFTIGAGMTVGISTDFATNPLNNGVDASNGFGSQSFSGGTSEHRLYYRGLAKEANTTTNITPSTNFSATTGTRSRNNASAVIVRSEHRANTSTGETSNPTLAVSGDTAGVFLALEEVASLTPTRGLVSFAELEVPLVPTRGRISFAEFEVPFLPTRGLISFAEMEVPTIATPTRGRISFSELEVGLAPTRGLISWVELEVPSVGGYSGPGRAVYVRMM